MKWRWGMRHTMLGLVSLGVVGCSTIDDYYNKWFGSGPAIKPAPLAAFKPTLPAQVIWRGSAGGAEKFVFSPLVRGDAAWSGSASGQITRFDLASGKVTARFEIRQRIAGGVGGDGNLILTGTTGGQVLAHDANGKQVWSSQVGSEVLSAPQLVQSVVVVRGADGNLYGLDANSGKRRWVYQRSLPTLTVRSHVGVTLLGDGVFAGLPGGRLVALNLANGNVGWESTVALPKGSTELERVADVAGLPVVDGRQVCAVAYQGRVACFDVLKGSTLWARDTSSVAGLAMDARYVYVSDEKSAVIAYDKNSGASLWKQDKLLGRSISAPVVTGRYVAVGDYQGYVHFLSIDDGGFAARVETDGTAIVAPPIAVDGRVLVQTRGGGLFLIGAR